jgi:TRAP-type C4-dicarboxylate transport system permease small subunit
MLAKILPPPLRNLAGFLGSAIIAAVAATLVWQGLNESAAATKHFASSLEISMVWFYCALPLSGLLMLWHLFARLVALGVSVSPLAGHDAEVRPADPA